MQAQQRIKLPIGNLLSSLNLGYLIIDVNGGILDFNDQLLEELGYNQEVLSNLNIFSINPTMSLLAWKRYWNKLSEKQFLEEQAEFITSDEVIYPITIRALLVNMSDEQVCCWMIENNSDTNRFKHLLSLTNSIKKICSWEYDLVKQELFVSKEWWELTGRKGKDQLHNPFQFILDVKGKLGRQATSRLLYAVRKLVEEGTRFDLELQSGPKTNKVLSLHLIGEAQVIEGQTYKIYGIIQDISNVSERSEEMYLAQYTLDQAKEMILWIEKSGQIFFANQTAASKLKYPIPDLKNKNIVSIHPEWGSKQWQKLWEKAKGDIEYIAETIMLTRDGASFPIEARLNTITYQDRPVISYFARDISEKRRRDEVISLFQHTVDNSRDLFFWSWGDGTILFHNQQVVRKLGYKASELASMNMYDFLKDLDRNVGNQYWKALLEEGEVQFEAEAYAKDNSSFPVAVTATLIQYKGEDCACIIWRDISAYQQRTKMLERAYDEIKELQAQLEDENAYLQEEVAASYNFNHIISKSKAYKKVLKQVALVAPTDSTVLIQGETGTGKELIARAIHGSSIRKQKPLIKVNCAALPANLIESELFGHEKGAFTGAHQRKKGRFEIANGATIFLDEIGEMPIELQPKLLRVLQEGEFMRIGGNEVIKVDVRLIAATNRDLRDRVAEGKFRKDLFYRLNVFPIHNLPLRERKEDIPLLVQFFKDKYAEKIGKKVTHINQRDLDELAAYIFPGNIRELENLVERALVLSQDHVLNLKALFPLKGPGTEESKRFLSMEEIQRSHIIEALKLTDGRVTGQKGAAALLKMNGKTLASRMKKLGIEKSDYL